MFEEIKAIVAENLGADKASITPETSFSEDLKADSLDLFEMVMAFEEHFGTILCRDLVKKFGKPSCPTMIAFATEYLEQHLNE